MALEASDEKQQISRWSVLQNRAFALLLTGSAISVLGDGFHSLALSLWILKVTGSAGAMSAVVALHGLIGIVLGPVAGTLADRLDRWRLMWALDLVRGALVLGMAWAVSQVGTPLWLVLALSGMIATAGRLRLPALPASMLQIVGSESLQTANSLLQSTTTIAMVAGPMLGGVVAAQFGGGMAMLGDSLSFFLCGALVLAAGAFPSPAREGARGSFGQDLIAGLRFVAQQPLVRSLLFLGPIGNFFFAGLLVGLPVLALKGWQLAPSGYGLLQSCLPFGLACGAVLLATHGKRLHRRGWWLAGTNLLLGPLIAGVGASPYLLAAAPLMIMIGGLMAVQQVLISSAFQTQVAPAMQGRVFGTFIALVTAAMPVGAALAGWLSDLWGASAVVMGAGAGLFLAVCFGLVTFRELLQFE